MIDIILITDYDSNNNNNDVYDDDDNDDNNDKWCDDDQLQIVLVSPWTHLVKNCESQSRTIESEFKKQWFRDDYQIIDIWDDCDGKSMW